MREGGGNSLKYLKRGWNRKEGRGNKDFRRGGGCKIGQGVGALKIGGTRTTLRTMLFMHLIFCWNVLKKHTFFKIGEQLNAEKENDRLKLCENSKTFV